MGYTTEFSGRARLTSNCSIPDGMIDFVNALSGTRRMKRNVPPKYGIDGEYYVLGGGSFGQDKEKSIVNYNETPSSQPGLWCSWDIIKETLPIKKSITSEEQILTTNYYLKWDGSEKFYQYIEWLDYLIGKVFHPYGIKLEGNINWEGEDTYDVGEIWLFGNGSSQTMEVNGEGEGGYYPYLASASLPKLNFLDLLKPESKDKQGEFDFTETITKTKIGFSLFSVKFNTP